MSKTNWHKPSGKSITADEWYTKYKYEIPICKVCNNILSIVAPATINRTTHFRHPDHSKCPTVQSNSKLFVNLRPKEIDHQNAIRLKEWVINNGYLIYRQMCEILGGSIEYQEFTKILIAANERLIWYYVGLTIDILPYTLLVNFGEFDKKKNRTGRNHKMYMAFDTTITTYEELWNRPSSPAEYIFRIKIYPDTQEYELVKIGDIKLPENLTAPSYFQNYLDKGKLS